MAEGSEEARGRPPGQDDGGGDHEPVSSLGGPPAAAPRPQDAPQAEPQALGLPPQREAAEGLEPQNEPGSRAEVAPDCGAGLQEPAGCEAPESRSPPEKPARLSAREYSRQVHEWLWQSYCGYLTWHSCLAAFPAYCSPQPPPPSYPSGGGAAPQAAAPLPLHLGYYNPFYFLSAATAGPDPGAAPGVGTPAPVAGPGPRAPHVQGPVRTTPASRVGSAAPSRTPSDTERQAGEKCERVVGQSGRVLGELQGRWSRLAFHTCLIAAAAAPIDVPPCASVVVCPGLKFSKCTQRLYSFFFI